MYYSNMRAKVDTIMVLLLQRCQRNAKRKPQKIKERKYKVEIWKLWKLRHYKAHFHVSCKDLKRHIDRALRKAQWQNNKNNNWTPNQK